ncbi:MAG: hypothetical protein Q8P41_13075 [Pseudomonadota bacterium]|nr:hypothetical protein [Pseudomonadota bacterium]
MLLTVPILQLLVTLAARAASPRRVGLGGLATGLVLAVAASVIMYGLTVHGCDEGTPRAGWLLSGVLLTLSVAGVERRAWRVSLAFVHVGAGVLISFLLAETVHGPTWAGVASRGRPEWHTPVTGLYRRFPSDEELISALVERMMEEPAPSGCGAAATRALAARAEPENLGWRTSTDEPCAIAERRGPAEVGSPRTSDDVYRGLLEVATLAAGDALQRSYPLQFVFLLQVGEQGRWLTPADACALIAALPEDSDSWLRGMAAGAVAESMSPQGRSACRVEIRDTLSDPGDASARLLLPEVFDEGERRSALAAVLASKKLPHAKVRALAASRAVAGELSRELDGALLALVDDYSDLEMRRSLAMDALETLLDDPRRGQAR